MIDNWIIQDIEAQMAQRNRVVVIDPSGECSFLLPVMEARNYTILKTDSANREEWERVKEELLLRYKAESAHKDESVIFYVTRPKEALSFLFDYCFTHGCVDLSNGGEWLRKKLFANTGHQVTMNDSWLLTAGKLSIKEDISWWKKKIQNLESLISIEEELPHFLSDPEGYFLDKEADVTQLFEEKTFELIGQPYRNLPHKTLATEVVNHLFAGILNNDIPSKLKTVYNKWLDSNTYAPSLDAYILGYKLPPQLNIWNVHPDHCFSAIDALQLAQITENFRDKSFVKDKLQRLQDRMKSRKAGRFVPAWWEDVVTLFDFNNKPLAQCNSLSKVAEFYTTSFHKTDRAIRNIYASFLQEDAVVRPLQEHYESLNSELLSHWFDHSADFKTDQQGYLPQLLAKSKPGTAIIVGDGVRYEIAAFIALQLQGKCKVERNTMFADMPSETEHNMSALYVGNNEVIPVHKEREKRLTEITGKDIQYLNLEALHYGVKADYLVLTYKDIDSAGEKLQQGAIKLFGEFENVLMEKILLLLKMGYGKVHLVTDHGFVLTGLLTEADKIEPLTAGKKEVHERFVRTVEKQPTTDWISFERPYDEFRYVYTTKNHRPFKSKGVYGFSHGGFTPQEIIIPNFVFSKDPKTAKGLPVTITNKGELAEVTGEIFGLKIQAAAKADNLFSLNRKIQVLLYANNENYNSSNIITLETGEVKSFEFSFGGHTNIVAVIVDATDQEKIDSVDIRKSNARDLGGLL